MTIKENQITTLQTNYNIDTHAHTHSRVNL